MVSLKEVQKFIQDLAKSDLVKLELKTEELELKVQFKTEVKQGEASTGAEKVVISPIPSPMPAVYPQQPIVPQPGAAQQPVAQQETVASAQDKEKEEKEQEELVEIVSPMVGTFYRRPSPDKPPYVEVGDYVKPGDIVCIIEAMKLFNEIESEVEGTIEKILVEDATPVEFGQPLFLVRPAKK